MANKPAEAPEESTLKVVTGVAYTKAINSDALVRTYVVSGGKRFYILIADGTEEITKKQFNDFRK